jgi:hypothetical protein
VTDESGFQLVNVLGGVSVRVGSAGAATTARYFFRDVAETRRELGRLVAEGWIFRLRLKIYVMFRSRENENRSRSGTRLSSLLWKPVYRLAIRNKLKRERSTMEKACRAIVWGCVRAWRSKRIDEEFISRRTPKTIAMALNKT